MSSAARSRLMASIRGKNTRPEVRVRSYLHRAGLRFRLHDRQLPGRPDLVFAQYRAAVFVHGCFWHRHRGCALATQPASNVDFWNTKFSLNVSRDKRNLQALKALGWSALVIWECETCSVDALDRLFWRIVSGPALP